MALELDCLASSHPIEVPDGVQQPGQIDEIFDAISYRWRLGPASIEHALLQQGRGGDRDAAPVAGGRGPEGGAPPLPDPAQGEQRQHL